MNENQKASDICCPEFNPVLYEGKTHVWENKLFVMDSIPAFFHMPLPNKIDKMMGRMIDQIRTANAEPPVDDFLVLTKDCSLWRSDFYFTVTKEIPEAKNARISGTFISKVYDGPYREIPKYLKQARQAVEVLGHKAGDFYIYYTTCPKCAKKYGHNYMVVFVAI